MKSLSHIEQRIFDVDGICASLSGPASGYEDYWTNKFNGDKTLAEFKRRFSQRYPGVSIEVVDGIGHRASGKYLMKNLRATYAFSWIQEQVELYDKFIQRQKQKIEALEDAAQAATATPPEPDPYDILGVDRHASREEIRQAYRIKIRRFHPDRLSGLDEAIIAFGNQQAQMINRARDMLLNEDEEAEAA
jgi:hypothetical protein